MRRTAAALVATLAATLAMGGPLAPTSQAQGAAIRCATASPPEACGLLDDLAAALEAASPILGPALAPLTGPAAGFAAASDQPAGVPVADVLATSRALLAALDALPAPAANLLGPSGLSALTTPLEGLIAELTAPVVSPQQSSGTSEPTPARTTASPGASRSSTASPSSTSSSGGTTTAGAPSSTSGAAVPDVPVGDPLILAPLAMPDFEVANPNLPVPASSPAPVSAEIAHAAAQEAAIDALGDPAGGAELAVVVAISLLLLVSAGLAKVHQDRHVIAGD